ncbi:MAG: NAD-dependent epimerase/dehydratase family protein, partial [Armatimonadota bacterium]
MRVLITGACGFLARELANVLQDSHDLILLDRNRPEDATMFLPGVSERHYSPFDTKHPFVQAEIVDEAAIGEAMRGVDAVVHLAASVTGLPEQGVETFSANALGTFVVLDAARLAGVRVSFKVKVGEQYRLFGSITSNDVAEAVEKAIGQTIDKHKVIL